jgi:hypothetical protein
LAESYFFTPITSSKDLHDYQTAMFFHYLVKVHGFDLRRFWDYMVAHWVQPSLDILEADVRQQTGTSLQEHWNFFVRNAYFSDPQLFKNSKTGTFAYQWLKTKGSKLSDKTPRASFTFALKEDYTAGLWTIQSTPPAGKAERRVAVVPAGNIPETNFVAVYLVENHRNFSKDSTRYVDRVQNGTAPIIVSLGSDDMLCVVPTNYLATSIRLPVQVVDANVSVDLGQNRSIPENESVTLTPAIAGGTPPYTYVWQRDGVTIGTGPTLQVKAGSVPSDVQIRVTVTDMFGIKFSDTVTLSKESKIKQVSFKDPTGKYTVTLTLPQGPAASVDVVKDSKSYSGELVKVWLDGWPSDYNYWDGKVQAQIAVQGTGFKNWTLYTNSTISDPTFRRNRTEQTSATLSLGGQSYYWLYLYPHSGPYSMVIFRLKGTMQ